MGGTLNQGSMELPIRLVPRNWVPTGMAFYLLTAVVFGSVALTMLKTGSSSDEASGILAAILLAGIILAVLAWQRSRAGSPYYHIQLTPQSIEERAGFLSREFLWSEITPFNVTMLYSGGESEVGTEMYFVTTSSISDVKGRAMMIKPGDYLTKDGRAGAQQLADWLNVLRAQAMNDPSGAILQHVTLPRGLWNKPLKLHKGTEHTD